MTRIGSQRKYRKLPRVALDYALAVGAAVVIALLIRNYVIEAFRIPTPSMFPALHAGDTIFVLKRPYAERGLPSRGDVIVYAPDANAEFSFIKRVLGLPGDRVQVKGGEVVLNGKSLAMTAEIGPEGMACVREKLPEGPSYLTCHDKKIIEDFGPTEIPENHVFVVGDLRSPPNPQRQDPREVANYPSYGIIPLKSVRGTAKWIWLSVQPGELTAEGKQSPRIRWERMFRRVE